MQEQHSSFLFLNQWESLAPSRKTSALCTNRQKVRAIYPMYLSSSHFLSFIYYIFLLSILSFGSSHEKEMWYYHHKCAVRFIQCQIISFLEPVVKRRDCMNGRLDPSHLLSLLWEAAVLQYSNLLIGPVYPECTAHLLQIMISRLPIFWSVSSVAFLVLCLTGEAKSWVYLSLNYLLREGSMDNFSCLLPMQYKMEVIYANVLHESEAWNKWKYHNHPFGNAGRFRQNNYWSWNLARMPRLIMLPAANTTMDSFLTACGQDLIFCVCYSKLSSPFSLVLN